VEKLRARSWNKGRRFCPLHICAPTSANRVDLCVKFAEEFFGVGCFPFVENSKSENMSLPKLPPNAALPSFPIYPPTASPAQPSFPPSRPVAIAAAAAVAAAAAAAAATTKNLPPPPDVHPKLPPPHPLWQNSALIHPMYPYLPNYTNDLTSADLLSFLYPPITPNPMLLNVPAAPMDRNVPMLGLPKQKLSLFIDVCVCGVCVCGVCGLFVCLCLTAWCVFFVVVSMHS